jgi:hypothetical protein
VSSEQSVWKPAGCDAGAVHAYQTEWPPALPAWFGSPDSFVAPTFERLTTPFVSLRTIGLANMSFHTPALESRPHATR